MILAAAPLEKRGFTLVEMLTVIAIIAILAGITFGLTRGVSSQQALSKARTELAQITLALEAYKQQYGDYPRLTNGEGRRLGGLLSGNRNPRNSSQDTSNDPFRAFIALERMSNATVNSVNHVLVDPWGTPYVYVYNPSSDDWKIFGYVLYSQGPDRSHNPPDTRTGVIVRNHPLNLDNIFPNE